MLFRSQEYKDNITLCDIQAAGAGVVGPNSRIGDRFYLPNDKSINTINVEKLKYIFKITDKLKPKKQFKSNLKDTTTDNKRLMAFAALFICGVKINKYSNMKCPFHDMKGNGNLSISEYGKIYCFDCLRDQWADEFLMEYKNINKYTAKKIIKFMELLLNDSKKKKI